MGVMTFSSSAAPQDCMRRTTCWCEYHLTSMPAISTMKSPSLMPPSWRAERALAGASMKTLLYLHLPVNWSPHARLSPAHPRAHESQSSPAPPCTGCSWPRDSHHRQRSHCWHCWHWDSGNDSWCWHRDTLPSPSAVAHNAVQSSGDVPRRLQWGPDAWRDPQPCMMWNRVRSARAWTSRRL